MDKFLNTRVRAIIVEKDKILLIHRYKAGKEYWVFPGGGVEKNDTSNESAVIRECKEELGVEVKVVKFFGRQESTPENNNKLNLFYRCQILSGKLGTGQGPEFSPKSQSKGTYALEWLVISSLKDYLVYPQTVRDRIIDELGSN